MDNKIILFTNSSNNVVKLRKNFIHYLVKENIKLTICIPESLNNEIFFLQEKYKFDLIIIKNHRTSINIISNLFFCIKVFQIFKKNKYDLILTFTIKPNILVSLTNFFFKIKIINIVTGLGSSYLKHGILKYTINMLYRISIKYSNLVIFQNEKDKKEFIFKKIICENNSVIILGSGIDSDFYNYNPKQFNKTEIKYLYAGRLIKDKGVLELLKSFKIITKENKNVKLMIVGDIDNQNPSKFSNTLFKNYESKNIIFLGYTENLKQFIVDCDFSILLSYREGLSNFLLESASIGRPLIATNVPGCIEIVSSENGFLCNSKDINNTIDTINKSMNINNEHYQKLSKMSRQKVLHIFDNKIVITKFIKSVITLLNKNV